MTPVLGSVGELYREGIVDTGRETEFLFARIGGDARVRSGPNYSHPPRALRYSPWTSMTHRLDSLALLLLLPLRGE
jgi:hypothetical protein